MPRVAVQFGEWRPDVALLDNQFASEVENVVAGINSYLPFPGLLPFSPTPLEGTACGLYAARTEDGTWKIYAGTTTKLYTWTLAGWADISRTSGGDYNVAPGEIWSFAQFGQNLIAINQNDDAQTIDIDSGTNFAALGGTPPRARNVYVIGDFVFLSGLTDNPRSIRWSAINDSTGWTIGNNLCDEQEFPDGGPVQGVSGGEIGYVVQERCIRTLQFLPGDTNFIFNFSRVLHDRGCISKYGYTCIGNNLYFVSEDGFYVVSGQQVTPIGHDKVDNWWLANSDKFRYDIIQAITQVNSPHIMWAFHASTASPCYDKLLIFDWSNQKWAKASESAQVWASTGLASVNLDLDTTGTEPHDDVLDISSLALQANAFQANAFQTTATAETPAKPLDSFAYVGGRPLVSAIDENGFLCALNGPNLAATLETAEAHLGPGVRFFVSEAYPLVDEAEAGTTVAAATRERLQDPVVWGQPAGLEITGSAALFCSARLYRFRVAIPPASTWTHAQGVQIEVQQDGSVA
jgi:hypothetical protein